MNERARTVTPRNRPPVKGPQQKSSKQLDLVALQQAPGFMIRLLQLQIFQEFFEFFTEAGFTPASHSILMVVRDNPSVTQSELAAILRIQLPNLVKILNELETSAVINRKRSSRDKRAIELSLTSKGKKAAGQASRMADVFNRRILSALDERDRQEFLRMLVRLVKF